MRTERQPALISSNSRIGRWPWSQTLRVLAGTFGAYVVAALCAWSLAVSLPMSRIDATLAATQLGFVAGAVAVMVAFAARNGWRACAWVTAMAMLLSTPGIAHRLLA